MYQEKGQSMETELLKKLLSDPYQWPFYLVLATAIIFVYQMVKVAAESVAKHLMTNVKERKNVLIVCRVIIQIVAVAIVIYIANGIYWHHNIKNLLPSPFVKPISTCGATVEIVVELQVEVETTSHYADAGGYLVFGSGKERILLTSAPDSWGRRLSDNEYLCRGVFEMDAKDPAVGRPVAALKSAEYIQVKFMWLPEDVKLIRGEAICIINGEIHLKVLFPPQMAREGMIFARDIDSLWSE